MRHVTAWGWYWLAVLTFTVAPEVYWAIINGRNTISDQIWGIERLNLAHPFAFSDWTPQHWAIAIALWGLFGWLSIHLPFGIAR